eukprot:323996_1
MTDTGKWIPLKRLPCRKGFKDVQTSNLAMINKDEFMIAPHWPNKITNYQLDRIGLFKYNIPKDKWSLFMRYNHIYNPQWNCICANNNTNKLYSSGSRCSMTIVDLNGKKYKRYRDITNIGYRANVIMVNDVCHIIGGSKSNKHYIWNHETCNFEEMFEFSSWSGGCTGFKVIHVKSQNKLFLLGGYMTNAGKRSDQIWSHALGTKTWHKLEQTIPFAMNNFGIVITTDELYAITFGGFTGETVQSIIVLDLNTMRCIESSVKMPKNKKDSRKWNAIKWNERANHQILIGGYIRLYLGRHNEEFPLDVVKSIACWYPTQEHVFLVLEKGSMWRMPIDCIISSTKI